MVVGRQEPVHEQAPVRLGTEHGARPLLRWPGHLGIILISHNMPNVFDIADRIHIQRLGGSAGVISPKTHSMQDAVAIMTGAMTVPNSEQSLR